MSIENNRQLNNWSQLNNNAVFLILNISEIIANIEGVVQSYLEANQHYYWLDYTVFSLCALSVGAFCIDAPILAVSSMIACLGLYYLAENHLKDTSFILAQLYLQDLYPVYNEVRFRIVNGQILGDAPEIRNIVIRHNELIVNNLSNGVNLTAQAVRALVAREFTVLSLALLEKDYGYRQGQGVETLA